VLRGIRFLNAFRMSERDMAGFIDQINQFRPALVEAYVQSLYELVRFAAREGKPLWQPNGVIVSAGTLHDFMLDAFKDAFPRSRIINRYGSRETGDMACSCGTGRWLHVSMMTHHVEVLDSGGNPVEAGEVGDIAVTTLVNRAQPLIRYRIGDRAVLRRNATCECGWEGDVFERVVGRTVDVFVAKDGALVDGEYFTHLFYHRHWVKKFQVVQDDEDVITLRIVPTGEEPTDDEKRPIEAGIEKVMGNCQIDWRFEGEIPEDESGKFRYTISNVARK
jgi:phenylacetate-CoA ligase